MLNPQHLKFVAGLGRAKGEDHTSDAGTSPSLPPLVNHDRQLDITRVDRQ